MITANTDNKDIPASESYTQYNQNGYLVFDPKIPESLIDKVISEVSPHFLETDETIKSEQGVIFYRHRIQDAFWLSDAARQLVVFPTILKMLEEIYQRRPFCFQTLHFRQGTQQAVHSDTIHFNSEPSGFMCGVWIALEDIDEKNGPLIYYPGSHKLPEITMTDVGVSNNGGDYAAYENFIDSDLQGKGLTSRLGMIKKGQAIIWAANLLHGGSPIVDPTRTRFSQVSHYFFEDCKYYIPRLSSESRKRYRNPLRIYSDRIVSPRRSLWSRLTRNLKSKRKYSL